MNRANALGFVSLGIVMCLLPALIPRWFPHLAIDGSSARALWVEVMGTVQCLIGASYLGRYGYVAGIEGLRRLADQYAGWVTFDWPTESWVTDLIVVDFALPVPFVLTMPDARFPPRGSVTLAGATVARWLVRGRAGATQVRGPNLVVRSDRVRPAI